MNRTHFLCVASLLLAHGLGPPRASLAGRVVAYNPLLHIVKNTHVENVDEIILKLRGGQYVKLRVESFGDMGSVERYLKGTVEWHIKATRDTSCDEPLPTLAPADKFSGSTTYMLTEAFKNVAVDQIRDLKCYTSRLK